MPKGRISGTLARGRVRIGHLAWDAWARTVELGITSGRDQAIGLRVSAAKAIRCDRGRPAASPDAITLELPAGEQAVARVKWE